MARLPSRAACTLMAMVKLLTSRMKVMVAPKGASKPWLPAAKPG